jgi:hypothetical protein
VGRHDERVALPATLAGREAPPARHSWVRWVPVVALAAAALTLVVLVIGAAMATAPATAGLDAALIRSPARTTSSAPAPVAAATTTPAPAPSAPQRELIDLAGRLPTGLSLTPPARWARWAGAPPRWARDVDGCPHISRRLGAELGGRWTYVHGTMPQGSCTWVPVPWNPRQPQDQRFTFAVGFRQGDVGHLLGGTVACAVPVATLRVPDVAPGAVLSGCDDAAGTRVRLALTDPRRTGVWYLDAASGADQHHLAPATVLPALVTAARGRLG